MKHYIGLIHKEADSDFGVSFPDFPGLITAGTDLDDANAMAAEALAFHIEGMIADGEAVPEPSSIEDIMANPENRSGVVVLVPAKTDAKKVVRVNITLPEDVLNEVDAYAEANGFTRSGFLTQAAKRVIDEDRSAA
ncbi:MAG TPA: type II toxin-antitoxin system HicB family antitoxin [Rhizobiaceae bacterium]|nr:type II toxin-antitoxin system HicB family antitoxin [Rhizobiaceae bacterium]